MWLVISIVAIAFLSVGSRRQLQYYRSRDVFSPRHFTVMERKESLLSLNLRLNTDTSDNFYDHQTLRKILVDPSWKRRKISTLRLIHCFTLFAPSQKFALDSCIMMLVQGELISQYVSCLLAPL